MTEEQIIETAKRSGYGPIVKVAVGSRVLPEIKIAVVELRGNRPRIIRWDEPIKLSWEPSWVPFHCP